jgi:SAM-dependent methyltransferase
MLIDFVCNICGSKNSVPLESLTREQETCSHCCSTVRYRALMHQLSLALFGEAIPLPEFPVDRSIRGIGTSDWPGFARLLAEKFDYQNTFFTEPPKLDLKTPHQGWAGQCDFVICSEVLEHVAPPVQPAFDGLRSLLKPNGVAILTVPYQIGAPTIEHFESLNEWSLCAIGMQQVLVNRTREGTFEVFDRLTFHGGAHGPSLEMRIFGKDGLALNLSRSGFYFKVIEEPWPEFGIFWPLLWSLPVVAAQSIARLASLVPRAVRGGDTAPMSHKAVRI